MDNRLNKGDWVVIDEWKCGLVSFIHKPTIIDIFIDGDKGAEVVRVRTHQHKITKITKEVADIMRGV